MFKDNTLSHVCRMMMNHDVRFLLLVSSPVLLGQTAHSCRFVLFFEVSLPWK